MGLFSFLRRAPTGSGRVPGVAVSPDTASAGLFSLGDTAQLHQLFDTPRERRDGRWKSAFFGACWNASVFLPEPAHFDGPDGLPYYRLNLPAPGMRFEAHCLAGMAPTCLERNAGAAFFRDARDPVEQSQWVVSMGEIDSLLRFGHANGDPVDSGEGGSTASAFELDQAGPPGQARSVLVGSPSREFLPEYTARALHRLMQRGWGEAEPTVAFIVDPQLQPSRNLVIGRKRRQFPNEAEAAFEMNRVAWMLPPKRGVMLMPEEWTPRQMTRLRDLFK